MIARLRRDGSARSFAGVVLFTLNTAPFAAFASGRPLIVGLGNAPRVEGVEVVWPNGATERVKGTSAGATVTLVQGKGAAGSVGRR